MKDNKELNKLKVELYWIYMNILYDFGNFDKSKIYLRTQQLKEDVFIIIRNKEMMK